MKLVEGVRLEVLLTSMPRMKALLRSRSKSERMLLLVVSVGFLVWASLQIVILPIDAWRDRQELEAGAWESRVNWLQTQPRTQSPAELRPGLLTSSLPSCGLELLRVNQEGSNILVAVQDQSFECVLDWLVQLEAEHAIQADELRFQSGSRRGGVTGTLRFNGS